MVSGMSLIFGSRLQLQHFYRSGPLPCPYLPGRIERKLFTRLTGPDAASLNSILSEAGFRRSHDIVYRPVCPGCRACVPVRIPIERFRPDRSMRRNRTVNADLAWSERPAVSTEEQYRLFIAYQRHRHRDSDMARMSRDDYRAMIEEGGFCARLIEFRDLEGALRGVALVDLLDDGLSAVYSFYDPGSARRGLGTFVVLALTEEAARRGLSHVYLGYWVGESPKMAYKSRFKPLEMLTETGWVLREPGAV
jgi:arginyl-tRNA--protein-N-Asp/Glu arginylyltransferase